MSEVFGGEGTLFDFEKVNNILADVNSSMLGGEDTKFCVETLKCCVMVLLWNGRRILTRFRICIEA